MKRIFSLIALTATIGVALSSIAAELSEAEADAAAIRWTRKARLGVKLSPQRTATRKYTTEDGKAFYGVRLGSSGTVLVADNNGRASILAFTRQPLSQIDEESPLYALISRDLAAREGMVAAVADGTVETEADIDDLRVMPFVTTKWNQSEAYAAYNVNASVKCYDYYTPSPLFTLYLNGEIYRPETEYPTPCGCVATAMAQTMRYWQYPAGHSSFSNTITRPVSPADIPCINYYGTIYYTSMEMTNELVSCEETAYDWSKMIECPLAYALDEKGNPAWSGDPVTEDQREAIGRLTFDCGVSVGLRYTPSGTELYTAQMAKIPFALTNIFGYATAIVRNSMTNDSLTEDSFERARAILTNLDAKRPVILLISGNAGGHAIVADGYGFAGGESTPFVHLNMGWAGQCDIWYNLPSINVSGNPENFSGFDTIDGVVYNIAPDPGEIGEIVSGHAADEDGNPVEGVTVNVYRAEDDLLVGSVTTDERGVYSILLPPSDDGYDIFASKGDLVGDAYTGRVAESCDDEVGNSWGNDLKMGLATARVGERLFSGFRHAVEYAQRRGETLVEVLRPCSLAGDLEIYTNLTIVATNAAPRQSPVVCSAYTVPFKVKDGAFLSLSNIVVSSADVSGIVNVDVDVESKLAVAGIVVVDTVTTATNSFEIAGPLENGIVLKCAAAKVAGEKFGTIFAGGDDYAAYIFNGYNLELAGVADGTDLKWASDVEVPVDAAFVVFDDGSTTTGYRSFDAMLANMGGSGEIRLKHTCWFAKAGTVLSSNCLLTSENADRLIADGGNFIISSGAELVLSNIVVTGSSPKPLVTLGVSQSSKGNLVLASCGRIAKFSNLSRNKNDQGGAVSVMYGSVKLLAGSSVDGCAASKESCKGGGAYLNGYYASLELAGGKIVNCVSSDSGGGVYAGRYATVSVTAPSIVAGNVYRIVNVDTPSDIYIYNAGTTVFSLDGDASGGSIGVYPGQEKPSAGDAFMKVNVDAGTATNSAAAFYCNAADMTGAVSEDAASLVWKEAPDSSQCEPERAVAIVVYDEDGETNYFANVRIAFEHLKDDATVYIATNREDGVVNSSDWTIKDDIDIFHNVKLRTVEGASDVATIYRGCGENDLAGSLFVRTGAKLMLADIALKPGDSYPAMYAAISVDGGELVIEDGTELSGFSVSRSRAAGAINVYNGGVLRMRGGEIRNCLNRYSRSESDYGVGAGVLVDNATAYFEGGKVVNCAAVRYAGVYIGNRGSAYVSGAFTATGNMTYPLFAASNFAVQDLSHLYLAAPLSGTVGVTEGLKASTNIFGEVEGELTDELIASAANFVHDTNGDTGAVATNSEGKAFLVWPSAFPAGEDAFEEDGVAYYRVVPPPPPPVYTIHYIGGVGVSGEMDDTDCLYGKVYNLRKCTLEKSGSKFAGWAWNGRLYDDGILIFNLSNVDGAELDFVAVWVDE